MIKLTKRYVWSWAIAGLVVPILLALASEMMPKPPEWNPFVETKVSSTQQTFTVVATCLFPAIYVDMGLSLMVMDAGGEGPVAESILFAVSVLINAGLYVLVGLIVAWLAGLFKRAPP